MIELNTPLSTLSAHLHCPNPLAPLFSSLPALGPHLLPSCSHLAFRHSSPTARNGSAISSKPYQYHLRPPPTAHRLARRCFAYRDAHSHSRARAGGGGGPVREAEDDMEVLEGQLAVVECCRRAERVRSRGEEAGQGARAGSQRRDSQRGAESGVGGKSKGCSARPGDRGASNALYGDYGPRPTNRSSHTTVGSPRKMLMDSSAPCQA